MSKNNKKKTKPQIELPGKYVYILIITSYLILSSVLMYISLKYYHPSYDETKSISEILVNELGNAVTVVTGLICILGDIIAEFNKMINPWVKRFLAISSFLFFNFCRCAMAIALSVNIIVVVFIVFYVVSLIIILGLNSKKEVVKSSAFSRALGKIHNQKILSIQLFDVDRVRVGEYDEYRFQRLDGVSQNNIDVNGILSATYKIKHNYVVGMQLAQVKFASVVESGSDTDIEDFLEEIQKNKQMLLNELKKINAPEEVGKEECCIARLFIMYLTLENMLKETNATGIIAHSGVLELDNLEIENRLFTLIRTGILGAVFLGINDIYTFEYQKDGVKLGRKYATFKIESEDNCREIVCLVVIKENPSQFISGDVRKAIGKIEKYVIEALNAE